MTRDVAWVTPEAPVLDVAELLVARRVSAVPVLDNGELVGIVSEVDLLHRQELGTAWDPFDRPWWVRLFKGEQWPASYVKSHAATVADVMSPPVITVLEEASMVELAKVLERHSIRWVPVLRGRTLVGIVSRSDLIRALVAKGRMARGPGCTNDDAIHTAVLGELEVQPWWRPGQSQVTVSDGVVHFSGLVDSHDEARAARVAAENIPGVKGVQDHRLDGVMPALGYW
ncbi:MAG TPA: CBS domain-containing protein [Caldimonas sp.]|nr:CBS domain-containing protein [Caldimonas sp.]